MKSPDFGQGFLLYTRSHPRRSETLRYIPLRLLGYDHALPLHSLRGPLTQKFAASDTVPFFV